jgi:hypothetical protein
MPRTPDRSPGALIEDEELRLLTPGGSVPTVDGGVVYDPTSGGFKMQDATGVFDPRTGGGGLTPSSHRPLDQLVHELAEDAHVEIIKVAGRVTQVIAWTDNGKTLKIREETITRVGGLVSQTVEVQYNGAGAAVETMTRTYNRTGNEVSSITEVLT